MVDAAPVVGHQIVFRPDSVSVGFEIIRQVHIHGHSHSSFGRYENRFKVAAGYVRRAMLIDLVTLQHHILQYEN